MTPQSFAIAQQAANNAYDMTLAETGDMAQAADDYKTVMSAYHATRPVPISPSEMIARLEYSMTHDTWTCNFCGKVNQSWELHCSCETRDTDTSSAAPTQMSDYEARRDWKHIKGDCAL